MAKLSYTRESVERALAIHLDNGRIADCRLAGADKWDVRLFSGQWLELRSLREAYIFVQGLASGYQAEKWRAEKS